MANQYIKQAHIETEYDVDSVEALDRCMVDPIYFMENFVYVQHPKKGKVRFELYEYQKRLVNLIHSGERWIIALLPRQSGKTITISMYLLWEAMFTEDCQTLIASKNSNHATEIMDRIKYAYEELPFWLKPGIKVYNRQSIEFDNHSSIKSESTTEKTGRGLSLTRFYWDECAFVKANIQEAMWTSLAPTLSTGGSAIISSTPNGDSDLFSNLWSGAQLGDEGNGFIPFFSKFDEHPERGPEYYADMERKLGSEKCAQEVGCQFISSDMKLMNGIFMQNLTNKVTNLTPAFIRRDIKFWEDIIPGKSYIIGVDPATGSGNDYTVIEMFSFPEMVQVAEFRSNIVSTPAVYSILKGLLQFVEKKGATGWFSVENNGVGEGLISLFMNDQDQPTEMEFVSEVGKSRLGFNTSDRKKMVASMTMKNMIERGMATVNSRILVHELKTFARRGGSYSAAAGSTDDCVSALIIVIRVLELVSEWDEDAYNRMYNIKGLDLENDQDEVSDEFDENDSPLPILG